MSKHRFMIELINKEDALDACSAQIWEGEAFADIKNFKPILTIPENPTNGDMLTALFGEKALITLDTHNYLKEWWNTPYNAESEVNADAEGSESK